ncbi:RNA polymerase sigma factor [Embleya sp. NPDC005575]|uniref:RNA polymerase sigma factor n=1 Tax=Embleya sp. NPDC005575 TaxID=3156892 RepID=UPI0033A1E288
MRARIRAGDPRAFEELFVEHSGSVYNHAFRLIGDWAAAEDVVALTFLEAWQLRGRVAEDGGSLRPWLLGVATNVTHNSRRTTRRHQAVLAKMPREQVVPDFADLLVERIDDTRTIARVQSLLGELRRHERDVIALCVWAGLDSAAAAEALGIPVGTVRSRLSRARAKLRRLAEREQPPSAEARVPFDHAGEPRRPETVARIHAPLRTRKEAR